MSFFQSIFPVSENLFFKLRVMKFDEIPKFSKWFWFNDMGVLWNTPKSMWKIYFSRDAICIFLNAPFQFRLLFCFKNWSRVFLNASHFLIWFWKGTEIEMGHLKKYIWHQVKNISFVCFLGHFIIPPVPSSWGPQLIKTGLISWLKIKFQFGRFTKFQHIWKIYLEINCLDIARLKRLKLVGSLQNLSLDSNVSK